MEKIIIPLVVFIMVVGFWLGLCKIGSDSDDKAEEINKERRNDLSIK